MVRCDLPRSKPTLTVPSHLLFYVPSVVLQTHFCGFFPSSLKIFHLHLNLLGKQALILADVS